MEQDQIDRESWPAECARVSAAFDLVNAKKTTREDKDGCLYFYGWTPTDVFVEWSIYGKATVYGKAGAVRFLSLGTYLEGSFIHLLGPKAGTFTIGQHAALMARGLYRLGVQFPELLAKLPALSHHEQLEARLSFSREFWPSCWEVSLGTQDGALCETTV